MPKIVAKVGAIVATAAKRKPTTCIQYYRAVLWRAWKEAWHLSDALSGALGAALPPFAKLAGVEESTVADLAWEVPVCALAVMMAFRIIAAPFLLHREHQQGANMRLKRATRRRSSLKAELLAAHARLDEREKSREAKESLGELLLIGESLIRDMPQIWDTGEIMVWTVRIDGWIKECEQQIASSVGIADGAVFHNYRGDVVAYPEAADNYMLKRHRNILAWKTSALRELINRLGII